jgi:hypothetical protein
VHRESKRLELRLKQVENLSSRRSDARAADEVGCESDRVDGIRHCRLP